MAAANQESAFKSNRKFVEHYIAARRPKNVHELRVKILEVWNEITLQERIKLILGVRKRVVMCLKDKCGPTDNWSKILVTTEVNK